MYGAVWKILHRRSNLKDDRLAPVRRTGGFTSKPFKLREHPAMGLNYVRRRSILPKVSRSNSESFRRWGWVMFGAVRCSLKRTVQTQWAFGEGINSNRRRKSRRINVQRYVLDFSFLRLTSANIFQTQNNSVSPWKSIKHTSQAISMKL